jgi:streptomycin 6-kinase
LNLPPDFIQTVQSTFGEDGKQLIENLPDLIAAASSRWGLSNIEPVSNLSFNFVAFANRGEEDVILKMGVPNRELTSEMAALSLFNGDGTCRLLERDEERGFLLLERLSPGTMLSELKDDDERTNIAVNVMSKLWREIPENNKFIQLADWFDGLKKIRPHFGGGTGPIPKELLERVESFLPELFGDKNIKLIHGDFHHFNVLSSERGWLAIDPKGVIGPVGYEVGPLMINPWNGISDRVSFKVRAERRVSILSERFGWEREKIIQWATAHAVLSAWWSVEDNMDEGYALQCAKIFSEIK